MNHINWGVIGAGNIARKFASACNGGANGSLYAIASRTLEKAERFVAENGNGTTIAYGSYEEMLEDDRIDAVYIATTNSTHLSLIQMCAKAGKHVLCEKPCVLTKADALLVKEAADTYGVIIMEALWSSFLPVTKKTKEWIAEGKIGKVRAIHTDFAFFAKTFPGARLFEKGLAGGGMVDVGVYCLAYVMNIMDAEPVDMASFLQIGETEVDEYGSVILRFENGVIADCNFGLKLMSKHRAYIYGEDGMIQVEKFWQSRECKLVNNKGEVLEIFEDDVENGFVFEIEHFQTLICEGKKESEIMPLARTIKIASLFDDIRSNG
ncbi:MAG: Gfo/Idh/MocA family oxidoreductase [Lachnospiraceae bacterium]